jgi:hypothetical protein
VQAPEGTPGWLEVATAAERPDLWSQAHDESVFDGLWPEYNVHGNHTGQYFGSLFPRHADVQVLFTDRRSGHLVARGRTIPFRWDGTLDDLPAGIDAVGLRAVSESGPPTALSALAAEVADGYQGSGLSRLVLAAMAEAGRQRGLAPLVAPVRPSWKDRYPLIPIDRYAAWQRDDGLPFDPWLRVHARLGARILRPEPRSLEITAPVPDWAAWTRLAFPDDGEYVFPGGLAPLTVAAGTGTYWEPNIWMQHDL